ncbi:hypothetical protein OSB04_010100 [Centaurea solstitialis]|uniref:Polyamine transporter n=1 Tax=Centaurea solstitialis TaxID=347529 RepID=A0AA38WP03_9ASTR|nr:hypothetical protein OSB04_010100 [Centaurea solstitialis]
MTIESPPPAATAAATDAATGDNVLPVTNPSKTIVKNRKKLTLIPLIFLIYFEVAGGPYGEEPAVKAAGPLFAILGFSIFPFIWSIPEALVTAELSTAFPGNGGYIIWAHKAFGPFFGSLMGTWKFLTGVINLAAFPILCADYLDKLFPVFKKGWPRTLAIVSANVLLSFLNYTGLNIVGYAAITLGVVSLMPFVLMSAIAIPKIQPHRWLSTGQPGVKKDWNLYYNTLFWNLNFWDSVSTMAGEVEKPNKTFPAALFFAVILTCLAYILPLVAVTGAITVDQSQWESGFMVVAAETIAGKWLKIWIDVGSVLSAIGLFEALLSSCAYQVLGMADLGFLPKFFESGDVIGVCVVYLAPSEASGTETAVQGPTTGPGVGCDVSGSVCFFGPDNGDRDEDGVLNERGDNGDRDRMDQSRWVSAFNGSQSMRTEASPDQFRILVSGTGTRPSDIDFRTNNSRMAAFPILCADYLDKLFPVFKKGWPRTLAIVSANVLLSFLNYTGLNIVGYAAITLGVVSLMPFVLMLAIAIPKIQPHRWLSTDQPGVKKDWNLYYNTLFWNLNFWDSVSTMAGEVEKPNKTFPAALFSAVILTCLAYILPLVAVIGVVTVDQSQWESGFMVVAAETIAGKWLKIWIDVGSVLSAIGLFEALLSSCAYQVLGMADLGFLPKFFESGDVTGVCFVYLAPSEASSSKTAVQGPTSGPGIGGDVSRSVCFFGPDNGDRDEDGVLNERGDNGDRDRMKMVALGEMESVEMVAFGEMVRKPKPFVSLPKSLKPHQIMTIESPPSAATAAATGDNVLPVTNPSKTAVKNRKKLTLIPLIFLIYFEVAGGPYGEEPAVKAAGPLYAILGFFIFPFIWSIPEALVTAELSTAFPGNGGYIIWAHKAFGPFFGSLMGTWKFLTGVINLAAFPILCADYLDKLFPVFKKGWPRTLAIVSANVLLSFLNYTGLNIVGYAAITLGVVSLMPFVLMSAIAIPKIQPHRWLSTGQPGVKKDWNLYYNTLFWNLNFWDSVSTMAGEVEKPNKTFPAALFFAVILTCLAYILPLVAVTGAITVDQSQWESGFMAVAAETIAGKWLKIWIDVGSVLSAIGLFEALLSSCAYQVLGMADLGFLPKFFEVRSKWFNTPWVGILVSTVITICFSFMDFTYIISSANFIYSLGMLLEFASFIWLRVKLPALKRPYRVPLRVPALVVMCLVPSAFLVLIMVIATKMVFLTSGVITAIAIVWYFLMKLFKAKKWFAFKNGDQIIEEYE